MDKVGIYILMVLIYLGISRSFSSRSEKKLIIRSSKNLREVFKGQPLSVLLEDYSESGIFFPTYHHSYKVVYGFNKQVSKLNMQVSHDFYQEYQDYLGMSVFRRNADTNAESTIPLPPGSLYIGDLAYGNWTYQDSGAKVWEFHDAYKKFPITFLWKSFIPTYAFWKEMIRHEESEEPFFGLNKEFGTYGLITKQVYSFFYYKEAKEQNEINKVLDKFIKFSHKWEKDGRGS